MKAKFVVKGMHCPSCEMLLKDSIEDAGVKVTEISHKKGIIAVDFDEKKTSMDKIKSTVKKEGYSVVG
jgi:copper chaperone CopZ